MVIVGVGIDVLETERMERALARWGSRFEERIFNPAERRDCAERADKTQALAARFAAKEACLKALGVGWLARLSEVEVRRSESGAPLIQVRGLIAQRARELGVKSIHVSLTHQPRLAAAVVVLEK